ncbi:MAG: hypothetical protein HY361_02390 [Candidatus Aenigmarchaeota archaeon]|nr:hypothetical protein [Candidatus Aenigmarchaeota archaeon]
MKILGFVELLFAAIIGLHLLYDLFSRELALIVVGYIFFRGLLFTISSKDFASIVDLMFGTYALLAMNGIFLHSAITIALVVWFSQKALFSLLLGH